jgi:iron complex outermembrane receptor protein
MRCQVRYRCSGRNHFIRLLGLFIACVLLRQTLIRADADQVQSGNGTSQQERKAKSEVETDSGQPSAESPQLNAGGARPSSLNTTVVVTAARMDIPLTENPASTTVVSQEVLRMMPKAIAAEEALQLVPGVKVDNQANGERVHLSIRGVGLLTERGVRGIKVLLDGVPLNDPTGFAPDLFDVDWATIQRIEVIRGPASALYGGAAAGGVLNIQTRDGGTKPVGGDVSGSVGSYGFWKALGEAGGTVKEWNYRVSASGSAGDGYRAHTKFDSTNIYGKFTWTPKKSLRLTAIIAGTHFFNENAEGLNLGWLQQDRRMANPDAIAFNEYQSTNRVTTAVNGRVDLTMNQELSFTTYFRHTQWRESVPSSIQHRTFDAPGGILQYTVHSGAGRIKNHFSVGTDLEGQTIDEFRKPNLGLAAEGTEFLSLERIGQRGLAFYFLDRVELGPRWGLMVDLRCDQIRNELKDQLQAGGLDLSGKNSLVKPTARLGFSWNRDARFGVFGSWEQGFLPPATEELANNPYHLGGFNPDLVPSTLQGEEFGARGSFGKRFYYDAVFFHLDTENDFGRYRIPSRPLETFYRNAGNSRRFGLETAINWYPVDPLAIRLAYTFSDFVYTDIKSIQGDFQNRVMPNSPRNRLYVDLEYKFGRHWFIGGAAELQSQWYVDPSNLLTAQGYTLVHPRIGFQWQRDNRRIELMLSSRNVFGKEYIAFTEPDPDGNSFQPAPTQEVFFGARIWLDSQ